MIKTFACHETKSLFDGQRVLRFASFQSVAMRKLAMLNQAVRVEDFRSPPGNRLEKLTGDRVGQWSIRINDQWRVCFFFENGSAFKVEIVDYH